MIIKYFLVENEAKTIDETHTESNSEVPGSTANSYKAKSSNSKLDRDAYKLKLDDIIEKLIGSVKKEGRNSFRVVIFQPIIDFITICLILK